MTRNQHKLSQIELDKWKTRSEGNSQTTGRQCGKHFWMLIRTMMVLLQQKISLSFMEQMLTLRIFKQCLRIVIQKDRAR